MWKVIIKTEKKNSNTTAEFSLKYVLCLFSSIRKFGLWLFTCDPQGVVIALFWQNKTRMGRIIFF